jgi:F-type H+-transporting ATPase subunit delta
MTKDTTVAARYARALFIVTEKRRETEPALADLLGLRSVLEPASTVGRMLSAPLVSLADKRATVVKVLEKRVLRSVTLFVDLLLRKKRLSDFETIVTQFESLVESSMGIERAQVVSAVPLTDGERNKLHTELERMTGKKIKLAAAVDSRLVGGALARLGDHVMDRSVRSLLDSIEQRLLETSV